MSDARMSTPGTVIASSDAGDVEEVLSALAKLTRTIVQNFPSPTEAESTDDDWDYRRSFPEFQSSLSSIHDTLLSFLQRLIGSCSTSSNITAMLEENDEKIEDIADPILWEQCMDMYDVFIQQVEAYLLDQSKNSGGSSPAVENLLSRPPSHRTSNCSQYYLQQQQQFKDMPKPQDIYSMTHHYRMNSQNYARTVPFIPKLHPNPPHSTPTVPSIVLLPGHGYDTRLGALKSSKLLVSPDTEDTLIAPSHHCRHCYQDELDALLYTAEQLRVHVSESSPPIPVNVNIDYQFIDTLQGLRDLSSMLESSENKIDTVAMDLEAHSYRSFVGMVCLIQMSFRIAKSDMIHSFIIDTLKLHDHINTYLASVLANPTVVKVLHGADMDIQWLQRDFGLYVVNLFDTGRAARVLKDHKQLRSIGYASLVSHYCNGYTIDKKYQLADWRQRPIPEDMLQYAIQDTYYLIDIYERMKQDLLTYGHETTDAIVDVLNTSRLVCAIRYCPEPFNPSGYRSLLLRTSSAKNNTKHKLQAYITPLQEAALSSLWDWRDQTARIEDESTFYVCTNAQLLRLAYRVGPSLDLSHIESLFQLAPPLILKYASEIFELLKNVVSSHQESSADVQTIEDSNFDEFEDDIDDDDIDGKEEEEDDDVETTTPTLSINEATIASKATSVGPTTRTSFSAFSKPASTAPAETAIAPGRGSSSQINVTTSGPGGSAISRGSPVLGTEALYKQAGWLTPIGAEPRKVKVQVANEGSTIADAMYVSADVTGMATTDDDADDDIVEEEFYDDDDSNKPKQLLSVNELNQEFRSNLYGDDYLDLKSGGTSGSGAQMSTSDSKKSNPTSTRKDAIPVVLGLVSLKGKSDYLDDNEDDPAASQSRQKGGGDTNDVEDMEAEFVIPRSIREIYMISNRNRRNKKAGSPTPERGVTPTNEKERLVLVEAEALLASRGAVAARYFLEDNASGKRSKPSSHKNEGRESEETLPYDLSVDVASKEDDFNFMKEIGWIPPKYQDSTVDEFMQSTSLPTDGRSAEAAPVIHSGDPSAFASHPQQQQPSVVGLLHPTGPDGWTTGGSSSSGHNPFFAGAAAQGGGPLQQQRNWGGPKTASSNAASSSGNKNKPTTARNTSGRQPERPERKESRTHAYRKR